MIVADASSVLASIFPDETDETHTLEAIRDGAAVAPSTFPVEIANAIVAGLRRKRLTLEQAKTALRALRDLDIEIVTKSLAEIEASVMPLALKHGLTIYDALYLDLAMARNAILHSADKALRKAALSETIIVA